jgi:hypothetical protein
VGGLILARLEDGWSTYFQRGKEASAFYRGLDRAEDAGNPRSDALDIAAAEYDGLMLSPADMHGQPDTYGDFWHWSAPDRRAA